MRIFSIILLEPTMRSKLIQVPIYFINLVFLAFMFFGISCGSDRCEGGNEKILLKHKEAYAPYNGNEIIHFLHNKSDTHTFQATGRQTYFVTKTATADECAKDFESIVVNFMNLNTNEPFVFKYEYDPRMFGAFPAGTANDRTYYKLAYKGKLFAYQSALSQTYINNTLYVGLHFIGHDTTTNYMAFKGQKGIVKIVIDGETWEIIE